MTAPLDVARASDQFEDWLVELRDRAFLGSTNQSFAMLRAVLQEVRDRLGTDDALRLADALPALVRGIMLQGWHPGDPGRGPRPPILDAVKAALAGHHAPPDTIVDDVLALLAHRVHPQHLADVAAHLPEELRARWPSALAASSPDR